MLLFNLSSLMLSICFSSILDGDSGDLEWQLVGIMLQTPLAIVHPVSGRGNLRWLHRHSRSGTEITDLHHRVTSNHRHSNCQSSCQWHHHFSFYNCIYLKTFLKYKTQRNVRNRGENLYISRIKRQGRQTANTGFVFTCSVESEFAGRTSDAPNTVRCQLECSELASSRLIGWDGITSTYISFKVQIAKALYWVEINFHDYTKCDCQLITNEM